MAEKLENFNERVSLAPVIGAAAKSINGTTAVGIGFNTRKILITVAWTAADDLLVRFQGDTAFTTIPSASAQLLTAGLILPWAIDQFKSSDVNEIGFKILAMQ